MCPAVTTATRNKWDNNFIIFSVLSNVNSVCIACLE